MYRPLPECLEIKDSEIEGQGLFAKEDIPANTDLGVSHYLKIGMSNNVFRTPLGGFYNHSDTPNCRKVFKRILEADWGDFFNGQWHLVPIRDIKAGEELTCKYQLYNPNE